MKAIILGSGTSTGVPRIGGEHGVDWGDCDPNEPKNRRTRASIIIENDEGTRLLIDTSTDLRQQFLANDIHRIDAVFWTHDHADHTHGIDDLRPLRYGRSGPIPGYGNDETVRRLRQRFGYVFAGQFGYHTIVSLENMNSLRMGQQKAPAFALTVTGKQSVMPQTLARSRRRWSTCFTGLTCWWSIACVANRILRIRIWAWRLNWCAPPKWAARC